MSKAVIANDNNVNDNDSSEGAAAVTASSTTTTTAQHRHMISGSDSAPTPKAPTPRIFKRVPGGNKQDACAAFKEALLLLMSIGGVPADRADLKAGLAQRMQDLDEDDLEAILYAVESGMASSFFRQRAKDAMAHLTPDEARAVVCLTLESPFPVYKLLNAWLMSGQRDDAVVDKVGPFFALLYRGLEKLPRLRGVRAQRVVTVGNNSDSSAAAEVRAMFDAHATLCAAGSWTNFWAFASFARRDAGGDEIVLPSADNTNGSNATIVYRCDSLECVDVTPFFTVPRDGADGVEVLPLPPLVTTVLSAAMQPGRSKTLVINLQQRPNDTASYVVPRVAASSAAVAVPERLQRKSRHPPAAWTFDLERAEAATPGWSGWAASASPAASTTAAAEQRVVAALDKTAPLAVALLRRGLTEEQILKDNWTALMSLPLEAVVVTLCAQVSEAMVPALERHATPDVSYVTPSSALSCELWSGIVLRFSLGPVGKHVLGNTVVRDALVSGSAHVATAAACESWCSAICSLTENNDANQQLFGTAAVRDALVAVQPQATTADACKWWCTAICNLATLDDDDAVNSLFGAKSVRDALKNLKSVASSKIDIDVISAWVCAATMCCDETDDVSLTLDPRSGVGSALSGTARRGKRRRK